MFGLFPIYLKATAGLRTLPRPYRIRLMNVVRTIMHNTTFNPFYFQDWKFDLKLLYLNHPLEKSDFHTHLNLSGSHYVSWSIPSFYLLNSPTIANFYLYFP